MKRRPPEHTLKFLLAFDGRIHHLEEREVERVLSDREIGMTVVEVEETRRSK